MKYTNISSMVLSSPDNAATRKEMALNDLFYLPVSGNISFHNPQSFLLLQGTHCHLFNEVNVLFLLFKDGVELETNGGFRFLLWRN